MKQFIGKNVHVSFAHPARVDLSTTYEFNGYRSVRVEAADGKLVSIEDGFAYLEVNAVSLSPADDPPPPHQHGLNSYAYACTLAHPLKYIASVVAR